MGPMKIETIVQTNGNEINVTDVEKQVKEAIKAAGLKVKEVKKATVYLKPNENEVYYSVENEDGTTFNSQLIAE